MRWTSNQKRESPDADGLIRADPKKPYFFESSILFLYSDFYLLYILSISSAPFFSQGIFKKKFNFDSLISVPEIALYSILNINKGVSGNLNEWNT